MTIDVDDKMRQLNAMRHEFSDDTANELVHGWLQEWSMADSHANMLIKERDALQRHMTELTRAIYDVGEIDKCNACGKAVVSLIDSGESPYCRACAGNDRKESEAGEPHPVETTS